MQPRYGEINIGGGMTPAPGAPMAGGVISYNPDINAYGGGVQMPVAPPQGLPPSVPRGGAGEARQHQPRPQHNPPAPQNPGQSMINDVNNRFGVDATGWYDENGNLTEQGRLGWEAYNRAQQGGGMQSMPSTPVWSPAMGSPYWGGFNFQP